MPSITFLGAARTVTGSKYLLDLGTSKVLVDAGLFQGLKELRERNWLPFPIHAPSQSARLEASMSFSLGAIHETARFRHGTW